MKNRAKQKRSQDTTRAILEAASQILVREGYAKATTNRIAERAGVSIGTLYHYFDNKDDIFHELLEQTFQGLLTFTQECPPQSRLSELLNEYNERLLRVFNDDPELIQALDALRSGPFHEQRSAWREKLIDAFEVLLKPHAHETTCQDLNVGARIAVCASEGLASAAASSQLSPEGLQSQLTRLQLAYLTSKSE